MDFLPMITEKDGVPVTTSRVVAEQFGKRHDNVLRDIEDLISLLKSEAATEDSSHPKIGEATRTFAEEKKEMKTPEEIRSSKEYVDAFARYLISENDAECRALPRSLPNGVRA